MSSLGRMLYGVDELQRNRGTFLTEKIFNIDYSASSDMGVTLFGNKKRAFIPKICQQYLFHADIELVEKIWLSYQNP